MLKIGLTGGIGSGKSTIAAIFDTLGVPVYYADIEALRLMNSDPELKEHITNAFGEDAYSSEGINREFLASRVFNDPVSLKLLNALVHPVTIKDAANWIKKQSAVYVIKEAALLFESKANEFLDLVIGVSAPEEVRITRTMKRNNFTRDQVVARMNKQMPEAEKMHLCDFIIDNNEEVPLIPQVLKLHEKFMHITYC